MNIFFLQIPVDTTSAISKNVEPVPHLIWFWLSIVEFLFIVFLVMRLRKTKSNLAFSELGKSSVKSAKAQSIDMDNLMDSINVARGLYKELSNKCHPDRYINKPEQKLAEEIFQEITANKRNFEKLSALKIRATNELNINF